MRRWLIIAVACAVAQVGPGGEWRQDLSPRAAPSPFLDPYPGELDSAYEMAGTLKRPAFFARPTYQAQVARSRAPVRTSFGRHCVPDLAGRGLASIF